MSQDSESEDFAIFAELLKAYRDAKEMTVRDLADAAFGDRNAGGRISDYENLVKRPNKSTRRTLARELEIPSVKIPYDLLWKEAREQVGDRREPPREAHVVPIPIYEPEEIARIRNSLDWAAHWAGMITSAKQGSEGKSDARALELFGSLSARAAEKLITGKPFKAKRDLIILQELEKLSLVHFSTDRTNTALAILCLVIGSVIGVFFFEGVFQVLIIPNQLSPLFYYGLMLSLAIICMLVWIRFEPDLMSFRPSASQLVHLSENGRKFVQDKLDPSIDRYIAKNRL